jgi:hypothetical protein
MIINVNDPSLNQILNICFYLILGFGLVSCIPWSLKYGKNRWTLALPIVAIVVYMIYELTMPNNWDILTLAGTDLYSPLGTNPRNPYPASQRHISTTSTVMEFVTSISYEYLT